jgi:peptidoglycan hydrolase CwlO-like protein
MTSKIKLAESKLKSLENDLKMTDFKIKELVKNIPKRKRVFDSSALRLVKLGHETASYFGDSSIFLTQPHQSN